MFDSHCHLHDESTRAAAASVVERAKSSGVTGMLLAGVDPKGWKHQLELARRYDGLYNAIGIHPQVVSEVTGDELSLMLDELERLVARETRDPSIRAMGEMGLDGRSEYRTALKEQETLFCMQLDIARRHDLPVVLHVVDSHNLALEILESEGIPQAAGVLHSCSAPAALLPRYLALGLFISFAGTVCHPHAKKAHAAARAVPGDKLLAETDAPFQLPSPLRVAGSDSPTNEPANLGVIIDALAALRGEVRTELAARTEQNARRLFSV